MNPIPKPLRRFFPNECFQSPVQWANWGPISSHLARKNPPLCPPVVVLSLPRSGSSWVGEMLSVSPTAMYLREPITQAYLQKTKNKLDFFDFNRDQLPYNYGTSAKYAFSGMPFFYKRTIVCFPEQWGLAERSHKRVLIKEVNPFMLEWFIDQFQPRIIYLLRHPAAVAGSFDRLGWNGKQFEYRLSKAVLDKKMPHYGQFTHSFWAEIGVFQAFVLNEVLQQAKGYEDFRIVRYEDICTDPENAFRDLYNFSGLQWDETVEKHIQECIQTTETDPHPYSTRRNTANEMNKWTQEVSEDQLQQLKEAYLSFDLPYYRDNW